MNNGLGENIHSQEVGYSIPGYMQDLLTASSQGIDALSRLISELLDLTVIVTDSLYEIISSSSVQELILDKIEFTSPREAMDPFFTCSINSNASKTRAIGRTISPTGRTLGYLFVLIEEKLTNELFLKSIMDNAASLYAVHLQSYLELKRERYNVKNAFLYDLLYGNIKIKEEVISKGEIWGWNFQFPHTVLVFILTDYDVSVGDKHLADILVNIVERVSISQIKKNLPIIFKRNELVLFHSLGDDAIADRKQSIVNFIQAVLGRYSELLFREQLVCGVGQTYADPTDLFRSYQEAKLACEMGKLLDISIPFFNELGLERILYKHDPQDLKEFYSSVMGELHRQDDAEGSLIKVLECYINNHFEISATADELFLHRNTLRYQLKKIENILGRDLRDCYSRLDLIAALKIRQLHKFN